MFLEIFSYVSNLDKRSLINCIGVSKKWQEPATQAYYEELTLDADQIDKIKTLFEGNLPNQDDCVNQLHWTKKLQIYCDVRKKEDWSPVSHTWYGEEDTAKSKRCRFEAQEFSTLPKLQEIDPKDSNNCDMYMGLLRNLDSSMYLKRIERIYSKSPSRYHQGHHAYFATYYNFRATLTHVHLNYSIPATATLNGDLVTCLHSYPTLFV